MATARNRKAAKRPNANAGVLEAQSLRRELTRALGLRRRIKTLARTLEREMATSNGALVRLITAIASEAGLRVVRETEHAEALDRVRELEERVAELLREREGLKQHGAAAGV